ncbi:hypothetical protein N7510_002761 [Penicillium lagena]|uniref:uncharacterized protein n=1 Tax=Penicillium lagena TaxID=94218 RepID=UPI002540690C|nr:uncharacterized protein N7510_002761 [Penicillium lagena]KAJ5618777.1 hypothetical protein N7510_002761 [Penicillium lagena]
MHHPHYWRNVLIILPIVGTAIAFASTLAICVKVSIVLCRRILGSVDRFRHCASAVIVLVTLWGLTTVVGNTFQCWPVQYFWIKHIPGHCMAGQDTFFTTIGAVLIFSVLRVIELRHYQPDDFSCECFHVGSDMGANLLVLGSTSNSFTLLWTILELDMAIICGSLLLLKPRYKVLPKNEDIRAITLAGTEARFLGWVDCTIPQHPRGRCVESFVFCTNT